MELTLGIDPGPLESAYAFVGSDYSLDMAGKTGTEGLIAMIRVVKIRAVAIESVKPYGKRVGAETFDTCRVEGRILQICTDLKIPCHQYSRMKYGKTLIGEGHAINDTLLRRTLLERFGPEVLLRLKTKGGKSDLRSAFAIAVYHLDSTWRGLAHA